LVRFAPNASARARDRADSLPNSVRIVARFGDIATIRVQRGDLLALRAHPAVASLKAPRPMVPDRPDRPDREPRGRNPRRFAIRSLGRGQPSGRGAVIGIVDWGCDYSHPNFIGPGGRTRLLALWDQRARGPSPRPYGYGIVHSARAIDRALASGDPFRTLGYDPIDADDEGNGTHGTHVMDIAAGSPRVGPGGVAPGADLVFVHMAALSWGPRHIASSVCLLEAVDFIARVAGDNPWVINLSLGSHNGPHDGTTLVEQALDWIVTSGPGRTIVQSCGNYGQRPVHAAGRLERGQRRRLAWHIDPSDQTPNEIELWYGSGDAIAMNLIAPDGRTIARALPDSHGPIVDGTRHIGRFAHRRGDPNNGDNQASIFVDPELARPGPWRIELEALTIADGRYHVWIERDEVTRGSQSRLARKDFVATTTTGTICNGHHTISVGAYDPATRARAWFSSIGPTRDGRNKPDLLAKGVGIVAARSDGGDDVDGDDLLTVKSGTSMASPHVAGCVAVLYEAAGRALTADEVKKVLVDSARRGREGPPRVDLRAAVARLREHLASPSNAMTTAQSPAELFDSVARSSSFQLAVPDVEVVAMPGAPPCESIQPGDLLIERALGEGNLASLAAISETTRPQAEKARSNRVIVRPRTHATPRRFMPAGAGLFARRANGVIVSIGAPSRRLRNAQQTGPVRPALPRLTQAEAIGGFLDTPQKAVIGVSRGGLFLRVGYDVLYVAGVSRAQQVFAMILSALVGKAYSPLLAEEMSTALELNLSGVQDPTGPAGDNEVIASNGQSDIGTTDVLIGLKIVRWLRDTKHIEFDPKRFNDLLWRRLEHAVAVEDAWLEVFEHTKSAGTFGRSWDSSILPQARRYYWVTQAMFTAIAWGLGPLVEQARVAYLARELNPTAKYGDAAFDNWTKAIEALWSRFNEGADPLDATRADSELASHPGYRYLFPGGDSERAAFPARLRFIQFCLALEPGLAAKAKDGGSKQGRDARKKLLDRFAEDYKIMLDLNTMANANGEDILHDQISQANANPFPCALAVSPKDEALPAGGDMSADMTVDADHWLSLWNYHYWWDLIRIEPDGRKVETSMSRLTMLSRRLGRDEEYSRADFQRLKREVGDECGPAVVGATSVASSLAIIRFTGTVLKDVLRAIFEKPYEKSLVLPGPGFYMLRCIAGSTRNKGPLHRVPSAAYHLFRVVAKKDLAAEQANAALEELRLNDLLWKPLLESQLKQETFEGAELEQKRSELAMINASLAGDAVSMYGVQRANLERGRTDKAIAAQISTDPDQVPSKIRERLEEIDKILAERTRRLSGVTGTPYRVITTLVTDAGTLKLLIEAVDVSTTDGFDVLVVDSTTPKSGFERRKKPTRLAAIRDALANLLENSVTGYGRGWCTILVPANGTTGIADHERDTFEVGKDVESMFTEMVEGGSIIISVLALLAAPFTGGASLTILIPMGIIGAIPSGYRIAKRNEEGTFAWDMETALDVLNIASAFLGVGQMTSSSLKFTRLAGAFKLAGHGADGLNIIMGKAQLLKELQDISTDPNLLPGERRYKLALALSNTLMNDGVMVGHMLAMHMYGEMMKHGGDPSKFPLPKGILPDDYSLPPVKERALPSNLQRAPEDVHAKVKAIAKRDVVVVIDPELKGKTTEVRYVLDAFGFIDDVYIALGPKAGDAQIPSHAATARQLFKFTGVLGKARTLISWARAYFAKDPSRKVGKTRAWEARVELEKLPKQITDYMRMLGAEIAAGTKTPKDVDAYIAGLFDQLAKHEAALKDASRSTGRIAADDTSQPLSPREQAMRDGRQQAHIVTGIPLDRIDIADAPKSQNHVSVRRNGDRLEIRVSEKVDGYPLQPEDIVDAIEAHQKLHDNRPPAFPTPDPSKPWSAEQEALYQGKLPSEFGYHWELKSDGSLEYQANDPNFTPRIYDPATGTMRFDPAAPRKPREPVPASFGPDYAADPIPKLYTDVPHLDSDIAFPGLNASDSATMIANPASPPSELQRTTTLRQGSSRAQIRNKWVASKAELILDAHFFNTLLPESLATTPPLVTSGRHAGKTPTPMIATWRHMQQWRIPFGGLRRLVLHTIQNVATVMQVHAAMLAEGTNVETARKAAIPKSLADRLYATALAKYGRTIATQSGHVITGIEFGPGVPQEVPLRELMNYYANQMGDLADPPSMAKLHDNLHKSILIPDGSGGMKPIPLDTNVYISFDLILLVEEGP
jgi:subtilisin family serine protease